MNYLVTGGAGFLGSHLTSRILKEKNSNVVCFDDLSTGSMEKIKEFNENKNFEFIKGDCNNELHLQKLFKEKEFDFVFHYAAVVGVKKTVENPLAVMNDLKGIQNILEECRKREVKKIVFASSSEVYGEPVELPEKEDGVLNAKIPYAAVKLSGEYCLKAYQKKYGLPGTSLRIFNVYGPKQISSAYGFVVGIFINQALQGKNPTVFGDGTQTRDFVFVEDNVEAALKAMHSRKADGHSINIGTGNSITINELAEKIIKLSGKNLKPEFLPQDPDFVMHRKPDITKMKELLEFEPQASLEEGLKKTFEWFKKTNSKN